MGLTSSRSLPTKELQALLGATDLGLLEDSWSRIAYADKLDAKTFQRVLFSTYPRMVSPFEKPCLMTAHG